MSITKDLLEDAVELDERLQDAYENENQEMIKSWRQRIATNDRLIMAWNDVLERAAGARAGATERRLFKLVS